MPGYDDKVKAFFEEHIHDAEEIRYILDGSGYFDVRDLDDKWVRIHIKKGDLMTLPEGIYHRFTCDSTDYIKAMRLFIGQPVWYVVCCWVDIVSRCFVPHHFSVMFNLLGLLSSMLCCVGIDILLPCLPFHSSPISVF